MGIDGKHTPAQCDSCCNFYATSSLQTKDDHLICDNCVELESLTSLLKEAIEKLEDIVTDCQMALNFMDDDYEGDEVWDCTGEGGEGFQAMIDNCRVVIDKFNERSK